MHWILQRHDNRETIKLHSQFVWADEFNWQALSQSQPVYTLTGAMDIQQGTKKAGRPISLNGENTWTSREVLAKLQAWADTPELTLNLTHPKGQSYTVIFNSPAISTISAIRQHRPSDDTDGDKYRFNVHFLTV